MRRIDEVIKKFNTLNIEKQNIVLNIIDEISDPKDNENTSNKASSNAKSDSRASNSNFISADGVALAIGDRVRILNNRKTEKMGI